MGSAQPQKKSYEGDFVLLNPAPSLEGRGGCKSDSTAAVYLKVNTYVHQAFVYLFSFVFILLIFIYWGYELLFSLLPEPLLSPLRLR